MTEFLGIEVEIVVTSDASADRHISVEDDHGRALLLDDKFFSTPQTEWLTMASLPVQPLQRWMTSDSPIEFGFDDGNLPVIFGDNPTAEDFLVFTESNVRCGLDIFGSAFFMLTRYEEYVKPDRDGLDRFPATASLAYQENFLRRPIVNEYLEVLWRLLTTLWPQLKRKTYSYRVCLSHDVDHPYFFFRRSPSRVIKSIASDLFIRKEPALVLCRLQALFQGENPQDNVDPLDTFDFLMRTSDAHGLQSAFYFIASKPSYDDDNYYELEHPSIRQLMRRIVGRGHEIGLHPSKYTYNNPERIRREFATFTKVSQEEGIDCTKIGGRQHYLRWHNPETWQYWQDAGLSYDSTLTFATDVGFRCGICYEYPVFNLVTRASLDLVERPLIIMERALLRDKSNTVESIVDQAEHLAQVCRKYNGLMTVLWHNSVLIAKADKQLYQEICNSL